MILQNELKEEIEIAVFEKMMAKLERSSEIKKDRFSLFVYGQGSQPRSFYRQLKNNPDIQLLWTGWSGPKILWFLSFLPGQAGLLKIINPNKTKIIFEEVGALSLCGLYFVPEEKDVEIIEGIKKFSYRFDIRSIFQGSEEYFLMDIDFDYHGGERDREIYFRLLNYGERLSRELKEILTLK